MPEFKLSPLEAKFADIVWESAPITSPELVKICERKLNWKKSTMYTVLKKLCERGIFKNDHASVSVEVTKDEFYEGHSRKYVEDTFGGSLPKFLTAFIAGGKLSEKQAEEIKHLIDERKEGDNGQVFFNSAQHELDCEHCHSRHYPCADSSKKSS
jgi:predicted transcriptional regulator